MTSESQNLARIRELIAQGLSDTEISQALQAQEVAENLRKVIFKADGTLNGLSYCRASTRRGAVLSVSIGRKSGQKGLTTSLLVDGYDFFEAYANAVNLLAEYHGLTDQPDLLAEMHSTAQAFLKVKGLVTKRVEVVYQQVQMAEEAGSAKDAEAANE